MNLVGELVTSESMVSQNPDLNGLQLDNFNKAARQLQKIINELQDVSMSVRMVPLSLTFQKMHRIVRDMCRRLGKEVHLEIIGEETEVDKNIIEQITNPLMHLIRNSVDHGIEMPDDREHVGKKRMGTVTLEAKNESGDVWIIVKDDGCGLNKQKIYEKARRNGLTSKNFEELTDREINQFILSAGFSTNEEVTEYSGRGVGMDVVVKGIENVGGSVILDSTEGEGTQMSIKIPLTLAIMEGMIVNVGASNFVIPITAIKESFKANEEYNIADVNGGEIIMIRGEPNQIVRLRDRFSIESNTDNYDDGIMIMVENDTRKVCLFVDEILGQRQVVVKPLPGYIKKVRGISGCTLLGDGSISLILDVAEFLN
jgi:two-component system chemotaxis sensor kinase CheA